MRSWQRCKQYVWRDLQMTASVTMRPWQCKNEKIVLQERRELYDLESLWTVGAEFDDATRLQILFDTRNSLLGPVGQAKEENLTSQQNMNQCLARSKTSYFSKYSCPIWIENNWRLDWVTRSFFHHRDCIHPQEPWTNWKQLGRLGEVDGGALWDGEHQLGGGEGEEEQDGISSELWFALRWENYQAEWSWCCLAP